eukprot:Rmarinus@m.14261
MIGRSTSQRTRIFFLKPEHHDFYLEGSHRNFFDNLSKGSAPTACGTEGEDSQSAYSIALPFLVALSPQTMVPEKPVRLSDISAGAEVHSSWLTHLTHIFEHLRLTHRSSSLEDEMSVIAWLFAKLLQIEDSSPGDHVAHAQRLLEIAFSSLYTAGDPQQALQQSVEGAFAEENKKSGFAIACHGAIPGTLFLAHRYISNPMKAISVCSTIGGDSTHRAMLVAALLGAVHGANIWPCDLRSGLGEAAHAEAYTACFADAVAKNVFLVASSSDFPPPPLPPKTAP